MQVASYTFCYDRNGNMVKRNGTTYTLTYDAENHLTGVSGGASASFVYDGDGNRVKATLGVSTTAYVGDYFEWKDSTSMVKYYYAGGQRVAMREDATLYYLLTDHLGSTAITADSSGAREAEVRYKAWGENRYTDGDTPTTYRFTGQRLDESTGLMYYGARYYDPALGRFVQADTIVPNPGNPQDLNRYAYAANSPLSFVDPNGHQVRPPASCDSICYTGTLGPYNVEVASPAVQPLTTASYQTSHDVYYITAMPPRQVLGSEAFIQAHRPGVGGLILYGLELVNALGMVAVPAQGAGYEMIMPPGQAGLGAYSSGTGSPVVPLNTAPFRLSREGEFTADYFRDNLALIRPMPKGMENAQAHHMLPKAFETNPVMSRVLEQAGISIHDPRWGAWWEGGPIGTHQQEWWPYNYEWQLWLERHPNPSFNELILQAEIMAGEYGLDWSGDSIFYP